MPFYPNVLLKLALIKLVLYYRYITIIIYTGNLTRKLSRVLEKNGVLNILGIHYVLIKFSLQSEVSPVLSLQGFQTEGKGSQLGNSSTVLRQRQSVD